jgi:hypothetical protein
MNRWTAKFLLLVMLIPSMLPFAFSRTQELDAPHCARQMAKAPIPCHGMAMPEEPPSARQPSSSETSFHAADNCCANHDCCRGLKTSEWARLAATPGSTVHFQVEHSASTHTAAFASTGAFHLDSARAPPLA